VDVIGVAELLISPKGDFGFGLITKGRSSIRRLEQVIDLVMKCKQSRILPLFFSKGQSSFLRISAHRDRSFR
jgi:hypothetical protein